MESLDEGCQAQLAELTTLRERFEIRADVLPADLALAGLLDDLLDASSAALELAERSTRAVYPLVRTAFEAAQRIVALATDDDYVGVGTRAWLYYQHKDASVRRKTEPEQAARWLDSVVSRLLEVWSPYNVHAKHLIADANVYLKDTTKKKPRPPDNFMGQDLAEVVQERYTKILGPGIHEGMKQVNRGIYAALSRDSHARLRIEPAGLTILTGGSVRVIPRRVDETARRRTLLHCLETSLAEATGALSYFLEGRKRTDAEKLRSMPVRGMSNDLPAGFSPDLGLHLAHAGGGGTTFHFQNVPVAKFGVFPDGTASWSANIVLTDREYITTFDVPAILSNELAHALAVSPLVLTPTREIVKHTLDGPPTVDVACTLGQVQRNGTESFVPFVVKRVAKAAAERAPNPVGS